MRQKVSTRRSLARAAHDRALRFEAKKALMYRPVRFDGKQALCVANGFARQVHVSRFVVLACSILPDHVHLVIARHRYFVEQVTNLLKGSATRSLIEHRMHPMQDRVPVSEHLPSPWATGLWKVFLSSDREILRAVRYVEDNPLKEGKKRQHWEFVTPLDQSQMRIREPVPSGRR